MFPAIDTKACRNIYPRRVYFGKEVFSSFLIVRFLFSRSLTEDKRIEALMITERFPGFLWRWWATCCLVNVCKWKAIHLENKWIKAHFKHETCYKLPCFGKVTFSFTTKLYEVNSIYLQGCLNTVINLTLVLIKKGHKREVKAKSKSSRSPAIITVIILIFTANFIVIFSWTFLSKGKGAWEVWSTNPPEDTTQRTATTPRTSRPTLFD